MGDLKKNKLFWVLLGVVILNIVLIVFGKIIVDKTTKQVIHKIQKEYSPSPYGPGFDPDKVDIKAFKTSKSYFESRSPEVIEEPSNRNLVNMIQKADGWRNDWEQDRGFSPGQ